MSRAGFPSQNLSPPQTYDTMQGKRRDSPILQEQNQTGTGRSGQSSPANQSNTPPPMNTKGPPQGRAHSPAYGGFPNGPSNGLPGQPSFQTNQQPRLLSSVHSRSASSTPPLSSMVNQPSRPGSAPPPTTGPHLSSPTYPPSQPFGIHSSPSTPSGGMPPNMTGGQHPLSGPLMQPVNLRAPQTMQPPNRGTQDFSATSRSPMTGTPSSVRPPWQAPMTNQPGLASPLTGFTGPQTSLTRPPTNLTGPPSSLARPTANLTGLQTSLTRPPISLTGPPNRFTGPPTSLTGPPNRFTGPPTSSTGPPTSSTGPPTSSTGPPTSLTGPPTSLTGPPTSLTGPPTSLSPPQIRPSSTTPTGQMMGSTGQPLMPPIPLSPSVSQAGPTTPSSQTASLPGSKRRVYPTQSYGSAYPNQGIPGTLSPSQATTPGAYGSQTGSQAPGAEIMAPNMASPNATAYMNNQYGSKQNNQLQGQMGKLSLQQSESQPVNLLDGRNFLPPQKDDVNVSLPPDLRKKNAKPNILCCTLSNIPENDSLLKKCKLPFGILVHPFKDLSNLAVIQSSTIVRCRSCRTYINPFVTFTESRRWRCNMCYRVNEVPEEFCYDPTTKSYGEPTRRPEVKSATYEFIAPSEYMLRAPQPAAYIFAFDVSFNAIETGYLKMACEIIKNNLDKMPGDSRALIGFLTFNKSVNFYNLRNDQSQPHMLIVSDIDDIFLPAPEDLLVNLKENKEMIIQFLDSLPETFASTRDIQCATGAAMQAALKLLAPTGGRITVFQTTLPSVGPGALENRDEPGVKSSPKDNARLNPATDFYKKLALDCAADQVSVDIFQLSSQYADCSSLMCASKYSGGCFSYLPNFHVSKNRAMVEKFENDLLRYITRKIGFEAVMRVRCTKGLSIHTFHGNFFVRSTDLLSLPNVNPDSAFGMQISIEDNLTDVSLACFQSALLYTSSKGERRIRVHNLALPVSKKMSDIYAGANASAIALMLSKMAVDRTLTASLGDAREALMNAVVDCLGVYKTCVSARSGEMIAPISLKHLPLYILSLLKQSSFRLGSTASLDSRCYAMQQFKVMPFDVALLAIYPALYSLHDMTDEGAITTKSGSVPQPPRLILSGEKLSRVGIFLMDAGQEFYIWVGKDTANADIQCLFGVPNYQSIPEDMGALPDLDNGLSTKVRTLLDYLQSERTNHANLYILRDNSKMRMKFVNKLMNDRTESMMSYHEFLIHIQGQVN